MSVICVSTKLCIEILGKALKSKYVFGPLLFVFLIFLGHKPLGVLFV